MKSMSMASTEQVKQYLAHWFQLGKSVICPKRQEKICPQVIFRGHDYSAEFEQCWHKILNTDADCYLEGTEQTIQQLLSPAWEIIDCPRCDLPIPMTVAGVASPVCTCFDLSDWPNNELPAPRVPANSSIHLNRLKQRLQDKEDNN
ncbi:unknown [Crocosphaera subtropica ATCC 51142]|uniref:Uncharacterized protein n=2 Tax=Crocosphaera TaxID=263510 RepID=B1WXY4_CROS5|nr:unknown [Crocosphaera subtropica ATCC 51142]